VAEPQDLFATSKTAYKLFCLCEKGEQQSCKLNEKKKEKNASHSIKNKKG
jgi:hypothetical protein